MSKEFLDLVKCRPIVDERAGKAVAQIVDAHIARASLTLMIGKRPNVTRLVRPWCTNLK